MNTAVLDKSNARGRLYGFLARALQFPTRADATQLASRSAWTVLRQAAQVLGDPGCTAAINEAERLGHEIAFETLAGQHYAAFGHTLRGAVPPYEIEYGSKEVFQLTEQLSDIGAFYTAFGMRIDHAAHERLDHIAAQLEFMFLLCAHQSAALEETNAEGLQHLAVTQDAQRKFLRDHLGRWGVAFGRRLQAHGTGTFLGVAGKLLQALLLFECRHFALTPGPELMELRATGTAEEMVADQSCVAAVPVPGGDSESSQQDEPA